MRETQMKKLIALAVAGAFAAPAMAADVTLTGGIEYQYRDIDGASTQARNGDNPNFTITSTSETDAGYTVTGKITWDGAWDDDQLTVAGDFGSIAIGNPDGGLDSAGDYTDIAPEKGGFGGDGNDQFITIKPNLGIDGLSVAASFSPATTSDSSALGTPEGSAYSVTYAAGNGITVYAGSESFKGKASQVVDTTQKTTAYGVKAEFGGLMVAAERAKIKNTGADSDEADLTGLAVKYSMGAVTIGVEAQDSDNTYTRLLAASGTAGNSTDIAQYDETTAFINYSFGGGLSAYVETYTNDKSATADQTTVGVKYSF
jgi:hypothetical protein